MLPLLEVLKWDERERFASAKVDVEGEMELVGECGWVGERVGEVEAESGRERVGKGDGNADAKDWAECLWERLRLETELELSGRA